MFCEYEVLSTRQAKNPLGFKRTYCLKTVRFRYCLRCGINNKDVGSFQGHI